jgi:hypothetical protein
LRLSWMRGIETEGEGREMQDSIQEYGQHGCKPYKV